MARSFLEICCEPNSDLSALAPEYGYVNVRRITIDDRFDLPRGVNTARSFIHRHPATDAWSALPCTSWCTWSFVNAARLGSAFCARLRRERRRSLRMVGHVETCFLDAAARGGTCHFEWPRRCRGWQRRRVRKMVRRLGMELADFDGCQVGVAGARGLPALKPWRVATTCPELAATLRPLRCPGDHFHGHLEGKVATLSGYYTTTLCRLALGALRRGAAFRDRVRLGRPRRHGLRVYGIGTLLQHKDSRSDAPVPAGLPVLQQRPVSCDAPIDENEEETDITPGADSATDALEPSALPAPFGAPVDENEEEASTTPDENSTANGIELSALQESFDATDGESEGEADITLDEDATAIDLEPRAPDAAPTPSLREGRLGPEPGPSRPTGPSCAAVAVLEALHRMASTADSAVARSWRALSATSDADRRDLFPLPSASLSNLPAEFPEASRALLLDAVNLCIAGLNSLHRAGAVAPFAAPRAGGPSSTQQTALGHVSERTAAMFWRFEDSLLPKSEPMALQSFEPSTAPAPPRLSADHVDLPAVAASCDPMKLVGPELLDTLGDPSTIFPDEPVGVGSIRAPRADRGEYVRLTAKMLEVGKMSLCFSPRGVGALFAVRKSTPGHLRPIWHGGRISELSRRPPAPRRLGNPASFLDLSVRAGEGLVMSKRDAASFFDVLQAPPEARRWFCCPPLRLEELARALDCDIPALERFTLDVPPGPLRGRMLAFPASLTWPMGFSWSSAIAQDVTLGVLLSTGFREEAIICDSEELPADTAELAVVATDDTIFFHRNEEVAMERLAKFDRALEVSGIPRAVDKDLTCVDRLMGLGCELTALPPRAAPEASKLATLILATTNLSTVRRASPRGLHGMLGLGSWFCILSRPHYSCFNSIYGFVMRLPEDVVVDVPADVIGELALFAALAPLLTAGLDREWLPLITACDAAPEYGFGASVCATPPETVADLGRKAERRGDFIRLARDGSADDEPERPRLGRPHRLGLTKSGFHDVLSIKAAKAEHSGVMELKGVLLLLRWLLRSSRHFHHRIVMLIDAKAALSAVAKGRTGAPSFRPTLCSINAHLLASDTLLRPIYIPSEDNPADAPSRGRRRRPGIRRVLKKPGFCKAERRLHRLLQETRLVDELLRRNWPTPPVKLKAAVARRRAGVLE